MDQKLGYSNPSSGQRAESTRIKYSNRARGAKIGKALDFANKKKISKVIILGKDELERSIYKIKDMETGAEKEENI